MENGVEKSGSNLPSTERKDWGASENVDQNDLLITKVYHQQGLSKFTQDGKAKPGDWCDSLTGEVLADRDSFLEVIIFASYKNMLISKLNEATDKYEWLRTESVTPENVALPYKEVTAEGKISRQIQYNYFALVLSKMDDLPYVISFSSTKTKAAKKLNTMFAKLSRLKKPSAAYVFNLLSVKEQKDKNTWFGVEVTQGRATTEAEQSIAYEWYQRSKSQKFVVVDSHEENEAEDGGDFNDVGQPDHGDVPF